MSEYFFRRLRKTRNNPILRSMVRETFLHKNDFIYPLFAMPGEGKKIPVKSMPGVFNFSIDELVKECKEVRDLGIPAVILFGIPDSKDEHATGAFIEDGIVQQAVRAIKKEVDGLMVITDVCLCEYTSHGHCGILHDGEIMNDETLDVLAKTALSHAEAGADMIAPSDMMDGRVTAIRTTLDDNGFSHIPIMSYAAKYSSAYYGPFRDAAQSAPAFGDRKTHQMDIANVNEAMREIEEDMAEGADIIMVKPAGAYLDVIRRAYDIFNVPLAAYQVSGEYSIIKAGGEKGWINEEAMMIESLTAIKRAGAKMILTYFAKDMARYLNNQGVV